MFFPHVPVLIIELVFLFVCFAVGCVRKEGKARVLLYVLSNYLQSVVVAVSALQGVWFSLESCDE